jgi:hypothetical protein
MFGTLFSNLRTESKDSDGSTRRRHSRRNCDKCVSVINGKTYPVENWSMGGLLVYGDSRPFGVDNEIDVIMKFKLSNNVMNVPHRARVIRKSQDRVAFEFLPLTKQIRNSFQNVVDDFVAAEFADSQLV